MTLAHLRCRVPTSFSITAGIALAAGLLTQSGVVDSSGAAGSATAGSAPLAVSPTSDTLFVPVVVHTQSRALAVVGRTMAMEDRMLAWDWEAGVALAGLLHVRNATFDRAILEYVDGWMTDRIAEGVTFSGSDRALQDCSSGAWPAADVWHPNHATPAWAALLLYERRPRPELLAEVEGAAAFLRYDACRVDGAIAHVPDQIWDDTLIVSVPLLARYGVLVGDPEWVSVAADQVLAHAVHLQDERTGLWYHGWRSDPGDNMSGAFWARGNGWVALATTELLAVLPTDDPRHEAIRARLARQVEGLIALQDESSGLWHTVLTRPDFYLETSGSAAIAAAIYRAAEAGWIEPNLSADAQRAFVGVNRKVDRDGTVTGVSAGTGVAHSVEDYNRISTERAQPYGQGLYLFAATAADYQ